jgi:hypothetical protein
MLVPSEAETVTFTNKIGSISTTQLEPPPPPPKNDTELYTKMIELYDNFFHLGCPNIQKKNIFKG